VVAPGRIVPRNGKWNGQAIQTLVAVTVHHAERGKINAPPLESQMDTTTLLIIVVLVLLLGGGGWYGRGRWYGK
jgi:hypothetical protein